MKWIFGKEKTKSENNSKPSVKNTEKKVVTKNQASPTKKKKTTANKRVEFRPFIQARAFAHTLKLKNEAAWRLFAKSGKRPKDIPSKPNQSYKNSGWKGMGDFLGTGNLASNRITFRSFKESREFVHKLKLKSDTEWRNYCKSGKKPKDIPAKPDRTYLGKGWKGIADWLGK